MDISQSLSARLEQQDLSATLQSWREVVGDRLDSCAAIDSYKPAPEIGSPGLPQSGFELRGKLGSGGMGEVHRALQAELERDVAFKTLRSDLTPRAELQEAFVAEAVVTGRLEHPNIVPVYTLGEHEGEAFMAMKMVAGQTWQQSLRADGNQDLSKHLEILIQVCNAVAFAHSRGIVHNDLKPANVMIGNFGEVLVLDWGLAVSMEASATPTRVRHRDRVTRPCGTPSYMPPELAMGMGECLGPWTDIYLLGGILFEILTGRPPHSSADLEAAVRETCSAEPVTLPDSVPQELRWMCERALAPLPRNRIASAERFRDQLRQYLHHRASIELAERSQAQLDHAKREAAGLEGARSARFGVYGAFAEALAGFRQARVLWTDNPQALRGAWDACHAYAATALAAGDLGLSETRVLELESLDGSRKEATVLRQRIEQQRSSLRARERARRRLRLGVLVSSLLLFGSLLLWVIQVQGKNLEIAAQNQDILQQNQKILSQQGEIERQSSFAERRGAIALEALLSMETQVMDRLIDEGGDPQALEVARNVLAVALEGWQKLREAEVEERQVSLGSAAAHQQIGRLLLEVDNDYPGALSALKEAVSIFDRLPADLPGIRIGHVRTLIDLSHAYASRGYLDSAATALRDGLSLCEDRGLEDWAAPFRQLRSRVLQSLAHIVWSQGLLSDARGLYERSLLLLQDLDGQAPGVRGAIEDVRCSLGMILIDLGELTLAAPLLKSTLVSLRALHAEDPRSLTFARMLRVALTGQASLCRLVGQVPEAGVLSEQAVRLARELHARNPQNNHDIIDLASTLVVRGEVLEDLGETGLAMHAYQELLALQLSSASLSLPEGLEGARLQAFKRLGFLLRDAGDLAESRRCFEEELATARRALARDASNALARQDELGALLDLAQAVQAQGEDSAGLLEQAVALGRPLVALDTSNLIVKRRLAEALGQWGELLLARRDFGAAEQVLQEAAELLRSSALQQLESRRQLERNLQRQGLAKYLQHRFDESQRFYDEGLEVARGLVALQPRSTDHRRALCLALTQVGTVLQRRGRPGEAEAPFRECLELAGELVAEDSSSVQAQRALWKAMDSLARLHQQRGELQEAVALFEQESAIVRELLARQPTDLRSAEECIYVLKNAAGLYAALGQLGQARVQLAECLKVRKHWAQAAADPLPHRADIALLLQNLALLAEAEGQHEIAEQLVAEAISELEPLVSQAPELASQLETLRAELLRLQGRRR